MDIGDYKAKLHGSYLRLLSVNKNGGLRAYNLRIVAVHQAAKEPGPK